MKQIIRLTESDLHNIINESVMRILKEGKFGANGNGHIRGDIFGTKLPKGGSKYAKDLMKQDREKESVNEEGAGGGGATNAAGVMQGGGTNPSAGQYDVPAFGGKSKKKVGGNAFSEPIMRQKHNLGDVTSAKANQVDMKPALDRTPGFSMGERVVKKKVSEAVDESIGSWLKTAALGGMMAMSPMQGNAQNYQQQQQNDSVQTVNKEMSVEQLAKLFPQAYKDKNANPKVWAKNRKAYVAEVNGKVSLVGKIAALHGQNPWNALLKKYCPSSNEHIFQLGDFDIQ